MAAIRGDRSPWRAHERRRAKFERKLPDGAWHNKAKLCRPKNMKSASFHVVGARTKIFFLKFSTRISIRLIDDVLLLKRWIIAQG